MNRVSLLIAVVVIIALLSVAAYILLYDSPQIASSPDVRFSHFTVDGRTFRLTYLATDQSALQKGLMGAKVTANTTELFVFPTAGYYSFWMYGVNSSLDIMWVYTPPPTNDTGTFVYLALDAPPCHIQIICTTYAPRTRANYVIEAKAGFAAANGIKVGTPVTLG